MNCPGHMLVFGSEVRSYRDLPLRFHEQTPLHRNEASGVLSGLTRVRQFSQDDAHCFVTEEQIGVGSGVAAAAGAARQRRLRPGVQREAVDAAGRVPRRDRDLGSRRGRARRARSSAPGSRITVNEGDGAFYGPKIDFDITDAIGRKWQCATIQLDYQMPERFELKYIGADNAEHRPVVIHRAIFGSFERFIALLIEHYAGAFPLWLAPVQAVGAADRRSASRLCDGRCQAELAAAGLRATVDDRQEKIGYKIREAQLQKIPYMLVVGDREAAEGTVGVQASRRAEIRGRSARPPFIEAARERERARRGGRRPSDAHGAAATSGSRSISVS